MEELNEPGNTKLAIDKLSRGYSLNSAHEERDIQRHFGN